MAFNNTLNRSTKYGCKITTVDPTQKRIEGVLKTGNVIQISVYATPPLFRWPKVGESWMVCQENGSWFLEGLWQEEEDHTQLTGLQPGDVLLNTPGNIVLSSGRTVATEYNLLAFAGKGDGTGDNAEALKHAYTYITEKGGGVLRIPAGIWNVSHFSWEFLDEEHPVYLVGDGKMVTKIQKIGTDTQPVLYFKGKNLVTNSPVKSLSIRGNSSCPGLTIEKCAWFVIDEVDIRSCSIGIESLGALTYEVRNSILLGNKRGTKGTKSTDSTVGSNLVTFKKTVISNNSVYGLDFDYCPSLLVDNCDIEENGQKGNLSTGGINIGANVAAAPGYGYGIITLNESWLEANLGRAFTAHSGEVRINNTLFINTDPTSTTTEGRDVFITGTVTKCSIKEGEFASNINETSPVWVDHECFGVIEDCISNFRYNLTAAPSMIVRDGAWWVGPLILRDSLLTGVTGQISFNPGGLGTLTLFTEPREASGGVYVADRFRMDALDMGKSIKAAGAAKILEVYVDSTSGVLSFKDSGGVSHALY